MTVEYLNLLQAKRIAGDADWLTAKLVSEHENLPVSLQKVVEAFLHRSTGFMTPQKLRLAGDTKQKLEFACYVLTLLAKKEYHKLEISSDEPDMAGVVDLLNKILQNPALCQKLEVNVILNNP
jgi:hypothetical protein